MTKPLTTTQFFRQFPDDETCLTHLFNVRFGQGFACPSCERPSNWYRIKAERAYSCQWCGHHLHPTVGTPFEQTRTRLQLWFYAIHLFTTTRHGVSAKELERQLSVTYKTAWRMAKLIREHMADVDGDKPIGGFMKRVEIDETFVGGIERNAQGGKGKAVVFGMMERGGDIVVEVVPNRRSGTLMAIVRDNVKPHTEVHTDEWRGYGGLGTMGYWHKTVNHSIEQYVSRLERPSTPLRGSGVTLSRRLAAHTSASARNTLALTPRSSSTGSIAAMLPLRCCPSFFRRSGH